MMAQIRQFCNAGLVLEAGRIRYYDDLDAAIAAHEAMLD